MHAVQCSLHVELPGLQGLECHSDECGINSWSRFSGGGSSEDKIMSSCGFSKIVLMLVQGLMGMQGGPEALCF